MSRRFLQIFLLTLLLALTWGQNCPPGCTGCTAATQGRPPTCSGCNAGYAANGTRCAPCPRLCTTCTYDSPSDSFTCTACSDGITVNNGKCFRCDQSCATCSGTPNNCVTCRNSVTPANGVCTYNQGCNKMNCAQCSSATACGSCKMGFYLDANGNCKKCVFPCITCSTTSGTTCTVCTKGFFVSGTTCTACSANCLTCSSASVCTMCIKGFTIINNMCAECTPPCAECSSSITTCTTCVKPYLLHTSGVLCRKCDFPCMTCDPSISTTCQSCVMGYGLSSSSCLECDEKQCGICTFTNGVQACLKCRPGYTLKDDGTCRPCPRGCSDCNPNKVVPSQQGSGAGQPPQGPTFTCLTCLQGATLVNGACERCMSPGCLDCDPNRLEVCVRCEDGSFLNNNSKCERCRRGCQLCDNIDLCNRYQSGWVESVTGKIYKCRPGCLTCDKGMAEICLVAMDGFYIIPSTNSTKRCPGNCRTCNPATPATCLSCWPRDILDSGLCKTCNSTCLTCDLSNLNACTQCRRGFRAVSGVCVEVSAACGAHCQKCRPDRTDPSKLVCGLCDFGFAATPNGRCAKMLGNCAKADTKDPTKCFECNRGFQLNRTICEPCPDNCRICQEGRCQMCDERYMQVQDGAGMKCAPKCLFPCASCDLTTCSACSPGFTLNNGVCQADLTCNPNCENCPMGTWRNFGACQACTTANCASCTNAATCVNCLQGFYMDANAACQACTDNCFICQSATKCKVCKIGFIRQIVVQDDTADELADVCSACTNGCQNCIGTTDTCSSCPTGFFRNGTRCVSNNNLLVTITLNVNHTQFLEKANQTDFVQNMLDRCPKINANKQNSITINDLKQGSHTQTLSVSVNPGESAVSASSDVSSAIYASGFQVLALNVAVVDQNGNQVNPDQTSGPGPNVGLIVGLTIGLTALVVILALIGFCIYKKRKDSHMNDGQALQDGTFHGMNNGGMNNGGMNNGGMNNGGMNNGGMNNGGMNYQGRQMNKQFA